MSETKHLKLKKPSYDEPADIEVVNSNMDTIDEEVKHIREILDLKAEKAEMLEKLAELEKEISLIEGGGGGATPTLPFHNKSPIEVDTSGEGIIFVELELSVSSNLSVHLMVNGEASEDTEVTVNCYFGDNELGYSPIIHRVQKGPFLLSIPANVLQTGVGESSFMVMMKVSNGVVTIKQKGVWGSLDGEGILGGATSEVPYAYIKENIQVKDFVTDSRNVVGEVLASIQIPLFTASSDKIGFDRFSRTGDVSDKVSISLDSLDEEGDGK